jgi:hypothetical protein
VPTRAKIKEREREREREKEREGERRERELQLFPGTAFHKLVRYGFTYYHNATCGGCIKPITRLARATLNP